jgi:hypothetical protein
MSKNFTRQELQDFYDLNQDRTGKPFISLKGTEVSGTILVQCSPASFTYWVNRAGGMLCQTDIISGNLSEMFVSRSAVKTLFDGLNNEE